MNPPLTLTIAIAMIASPLFAQLQTTGLPAEFDKAETQVATCCDDCEDRLGSLERRMAQVERDQVTEERVREICREEINVAFRIRTSGGATRTTRSTPIACADGQCGIAIRPGERIIAINGQPVSYSASADEQSSGTYFTPTYTAIRQSNGQVIVRRRGPVRKIAVGTARVVKKTINGAGRAVTAPFRVRACRN